MNSIAGVVGATGLALLTAICPQETAAEGFSGTEFLTWEQPSQDSYIGTAVVMATFIATRTNAQTAECLNGWYANNVGLTERRNAEIRDAIARNADYHPSAVIMLLMEDACGSFAAK